MKYTCYGAIVAITMLQTVHNLVAQSAKRLQLAPSEIQKILEPNVVHEFTITLQNGKQFKAFRSQHSNARGPYKGGIRFHPDVNKQEVVALSILMSLKTALVGIPLGGGKGGIAVDPSQLTHQELEELSRLYVRALADHIGPHKDIPAPDVQTNAQIIDWMVDEYSLLSGDTSRASFTGKSLLNGGSKGREEATGRGGYVVMKTIIESAAVSSPTYALQGIGNVGTYFAQLAANHVPMWRCIAAADSRSAIAHNNLGISELIHYKKTHKTLKNFPNSKQVTTTDLLSTDCTILVLAALGGVVTVDNASEIQAKYILELANGPVIDEALPILSEKNCVVIPDILANAGGVVASYYEWLQNIHNEQWTEADVREKLDATMVSATRAVQQRALQQDISLKESAIDVAITNLMSATT